MAHASFRRLLIYPTGYSTTQQLDPSSWRLPRQKPSTVGHHVQSRRHSDEHGNYPAKATTMVFVQYSNKTPWDSPIIQLRAFEKTNTLAPGGSQVMQLDIMRKGLSVWDVVSQNWLIPSTMDDFVFWIGDSGVGLTLAREGSTGICGNWRTCPV